MKYNIRTIRNRKVMTIENKIVSANILSIEAGTNGYHGGDSGHGSRTYIRIANSGGTDMNVIAKLDEVIIELGGDTELETIINALEWIASVLKIQCNETDKDWDWE